MDPMSQSHYISSYLMCPICRQTAEHPKMCPKCSRIFCDDCLQNNHRRAQECYTCKTKLKLNDYVDCSCFLRFVQREINKIKDEISEKQKCSEHKLAVSYFCQDCHIPICSDCGMLSQKHRNHTFISFRQIYEDIKKKVLSQFHRFDKKIAICENRKLFLRGKSDALLNEHKKYKKSFEEAYIKYTQQIQREGKAIQDSIHEQHESNLQQLKQLQGFRDQIYEQIEKKTHLGLINSTPHLVASISTLQSQHISHLPNLQEFSNKKQFSFSATDQLAPEYNSFCFKLRNYSTSSGIIYSQSYFVNGIEWRLKVYPKGNGTGKDKYLSVFVEMTQAFTSQNRYEYIIELITDLEMFDNIKRDYCSVFEIGECWGYNQFALIEELEEKGFLRDDTLTFNIKIRNRSYRSLVEDQAHYIQSLKKKIMEKKIVEELEREKQIQRERLREKERIEKERLQKERKRQKQKEKEKEKEKQKEKQKEKDKEKEKEKEKEKFKEKQREKDSEDTDRIMHRMQKDKVKNSLKKRKESTKLTDKGLLLDNIFSKEVQKQKHSFKNRQKSENKQKYQIDSSSSDYFLEREKKFQKSQKLDQSSRIWEKESFTKDKIIQKIKEMYKKE